MDSALPQDRMIQLKNLSVANLLNVKIPVNHKSQRDLSGSEIPINLKNLIIKRFSSASRHNYAMAYFDE